jgi:hypothetical protein
VKFHYETKGYVMFHYETKGYAQFHFVTKGYEKFHPEITGYLKSKVKQINTWCWDLRQDTWYLNLWRSDMCFSNLRQSDIWCFTLRQKQGHTSTRNTLMQDQTLPFVGQICQKLQPSNNLVLSVVYNTNHDLYVSYHIKLDDKSDCVVS